MMISPTVIFGAYTVTPVRHDDERGHFMRTYCEEEFERYGLNTSWPQHNISHSRTKGTLRGLHFQAPPHAEDKLVHVVHGSAFVAVVDIRHAGMAFGRCLTLTLSAEDGGMLYVPKGCAFGFQTLTDEVDILYRMSDPYHPELARGIAWNDATLAIEWPLPPTCLSERDVNLPHLEQAHDAFLRTQPISPNGHKAHTTSVFQIR